MARPAVPESQRKREYRLTLDPVTIRTLRSVEKQAHVEGLSAAVRHLARRHRERNLAKAEKPDAVST